MLVINVPKTRLFNESTNSFVDIEGGRLELEHSLVSVSKWEAETHKPFLSKKEFTADEVLLYIKCMTLNDVSSDIYLGITQSNMTEIMKYMQDSHTATWFPEDKTPSGKGLKSSEVMTSELAYYYMSAAGIPFECENWNLNRLMVLLRIASTKSQPPKKMSKGAIAKQNSALNAARLKGRRH